MRAGGLELGIRTRIMIFTAVTAVATLVGALVLMYVVSEASIARQERIDVTSSVSRTEAVVDEKVEDLDSFARDWSIWDPLYSFVRNPAAMPAFVAQNVVSPQAMQALGVDVFIVADTKGRIVFASAVAPNSTLTTEAPASVRRYAVMRATSPAGSSTGASVHGLMNTESGPMMLVAQPIVHSDKSGPVAGTLVFGRYLDADTLAVIERITQSTVAFRAPSGSLMATDLAQVRAQLRVNGSPVIVPVSGTSLSGFETLPGIGGPAAILQVTLPRSARLVAQSLYANVIGWVVLVTAVVAIALYVTLDRMVGSRLLLLSLEVADVAASEDLDRRVERMGTDEIGRLSDEINTMLATVQTSGVRLRESNAKLERMVYDVAESMGRVVEARDPYTQGHQEGVSRLSGQIAREMKLSEDLVSSVEFAGIVHDIGKLAIPAEILSRPGKLSETEMSLIREHPLRGHEILSGIDFPWPIDDIVLQHHERMDGSGYPLGLSDGQITLEARIIAVADVVEAMASHRPYRASLGVDAAIEYLRSEPGKFDPEVVAACVRLWEAGAIDL